MFRLQRRATRFGGAPKKRRHRCGAVRSLHLRPASPTPSIGFLHPISSIACMLCTVSRKRKVTLPIAGKTRAEVSASRIKFTGKPPIHWDHFACRTDICFDAAATASSKFVTAKFHVFKAVKSPHHLTDHNELDIIPLRVGFYNYWHIKKG